MTKPTQRLVALSRIPNANRYGTRRLLAGDEFDAGANDARLLLLAKKAKPAAKREAVKLSAPPLIVTDKVAKAERKHKVDPTEQPPAVTQPQPANETTDDLAAARADYQEAVGKRPFHGWSAEELRAKIAAGTEAAADDDIDLDEVTAS